MVMTCCDFPEELLVEILSFLPPESLMRFKCVSKSWYALINLLIKDTTFVNKHLGNIDSRILSSITCLVFWCPETIRWRRTELEHARRKLFKSVTVFHDGNQSDRINYGCEDFDLPTFSSEVNLPRVLRSHCNGIICLANFKTIILCNPAIKEWRIIPKPCLDDYGGFSARQVAFGYDSRANDYKVVRFGCERLHHGGIEYYKTRAEVYSMRSDSWKEIGIQLEFDRFPHLGKEVFSKGSFYWFARTHNIIISFNMFDEMFDSIPLPNNLLVARIDHSIRLAVWNGSVALFLYKHEIAVTTNSIEVWLMGDYSGGIKGSYSWIKKLILGPLTGVALPLTFLKNDEVLMQTTDGWFVLYNLRSQILRKLTFIEAENTGPDWDFSYVKSLISVHGESL